MKKNLAFFFVGGVFGLVAGAAAMLIAFPFLFPPPPLSESIAPDKIDSLLVSTAFRKDVDGQDAAHWGEGDIKIYQGANGDILLELQGNFEVGPGPNFWLYLNTIADVNNEEDFEEDAGRVRVTKLKSFSGSQVYSLPEMEYQNAKALTIWCETFGQYIASANLI